MIMFRQNYIQFIIPDMATILLDIGQ